MRTEPILVLEGLERIDSIFYDEVRVPLEAFVAVDCLRDGATVRLAVANVAVVWGWKDTAPVTI